MPHLKLTLPEQSDIQYDLIAYRLTEEIINLFYRPDGRLTREELMERTTVHFAPYRPNEYFVAGRTVSERRRPDITVELSDWYMSVKTRRIVGAALTNVLAEIFSIPDTELDNINVRFYSYSPKELTVAGKMVTDFIPFSTRMAKRLFGR